MDRQFQSKVSYGNFVLLAAMLSVAVYFVWHTPSLTRPVAGTLLAADLLAMVVIIERMIHTTYTVTADRRLIIHHGRLSRDRVIYLDDIIRIDRINGIKIGGRPLRSHLAVITADNAEHYVAPTNEQDFIKCIKKRKDLEQP